MKLINIEIKNFRSIREETIKFSPNCRILVGINESGKSNILRALSLLSKETKIVDTDISEVPPDEGYVDNAFVRFFFDLEKKEVEELIKNVKNKVVAGNEDFVLMKSENREVTIKEICEANEGGTFHVDLLKKERYPQYFKFELQPNVPDGLLKVSAKCPPNYKIKDNKGTSYIINPNQLINHHNFNSLNSGYLEKINTEEIGNLIGNEVAKIILKYKPESIFWKYDKKNVLPDTINLAQFASDPNNCLFLKHMFSLTGIKDISTEIRNAQQRGTTALKNLLNRVANQSTKYINEIWKEYQTIQFDLVQNGDNIDASIKDTYNNFPMKFRSDGFKQFVTFMLMISVRVKKDDLKGYIILIDEPGISLHPSGCRYLRDELIKISEKNIVIFSTHSIFMIDRDNISRHLIIKKKNEKTSIIGAKESNIFDEEVLYRAMNYSIFENLKQENILFEGWRDQKLFKVALSKLPTEYKHLESEYKKIGCAYSQGVKGIGFITPLLELANRNCFIMSDADEPAKKLQRQFNEKKLYGTWKRYDEILRGTSEITGEDFIKKEVFVDLCEKIRKNNPKLSKLTKIELQNSKGVIYALVNWVGIDTINKDRQKKIIESIKETVFSELKQSQIELNYYKLLEKLKEQINKHDR